MSLCPTCPVVSCDPGDPYKLYSLQSEIYPFVVNCPPGYNCNPQGGGTINLVCCDDYVATRTLPLQLTQAIYDAVVQGMIQECAQHIQFCEKSSIIPDPVVLYSNTPQNCTKYCPDGTPWHYTVPAGQFMAFNQAQANFAAQQAACYFALQTITCLTMTNPICCANTAYYGRIIASGGGLANPPQPNTWAVTSGTVPPGLTVQTGQVVGSFITITGTPTTSGTYGFTVQLISPLGFTVTKSFTISVIAIIPVTIPNATIGIPYSLQLVASGAPTGATVTWSISSGSLPSGLTLAPLTGLISGTPVALPSTFTVTATFA